ncbi:MAG: signal recognition particle receptor subunit alpha [Candidatus Anstonellales archaeon]
MNDVFSRFRQAFKDFMSKIAINENDINEMLKELQKALISSDVDIKLTFEITNKLKQRILSDKSDGFTLKQKAIKALYEELESMFGISYNVEIKRQVIALIGLYGSGKTTTAGKIAMFFKKKGLSIAMLSTDKERQAAQEQLEQIAKQVSANFYSIDKLDQLIKSRKEDILIIDTAGKNALDEELLRTLKDEYEKIKPDTVFLVISADIGKVAIEQAAAFNRAMPITAAIITKFDGSGKAGGALSALARLKVPIAFIGTGEKMDALQQYSSKSIIAKILGMPDIDALIKKFEALKEEEIKEGEFNLETFYNQLKAFKSNPLQDIASMVGLYDIPKQALLQGEQKISKYEAMINSMTKEERRNPEIVKKSESRIRRIAKGSGLSEQEVINLLNEYFKTEKIVKKLASDKGMIKKIQKMFPGFKFG